MPTTRREDGGITPVHIQTLTACGTAVGITAVATKMESTGLSSGVELIL